MLEVEARLGHAPPERRLCAVDLGCGIGRDVVFLASRGWRVFAVDNHPHILSKLREFCDRHGLAISSLVSIKNISVSIPIHPRGHPDTPTPFTCFLSDIPYHLIHLSRFLKRSVLAHLRQHLRLNTYLAIYHFCQDSENAFGRAVSF